MFDVAAAAVEGALAAGARYADARVMVMRTEGMTVRNAVVEGLRQSETAGVGVRALIGSSWGFYATPVLSTRRLGPPARRRPPSPAPRPSSPDRRSSWRRARRHRRQAHWDSTWVEHPIDDVSLSEKGDLLVGVTKTINDVRRRPRRGQLRHLGHREVARLQRGPPHQPAPRRVRRRHGARRPSATARPSAGATPASAASTAPAAGSSSAASTSPATPSASPRRRSRCCRRRSARRSTRPT